LDYFVAVQETLWSSEGYDAGDETGIQSTIFTSSPSYRALERLVRELRLVEPPTYWHVSEWYFRSNRFPVYTPPRTIRYRSHGTLFEDTRLTQSHQLRLSFNRQVLVDQVKEGVDWLGSNWDNHAGEPVGRWQDGGVMRWPLEPFVPDELTAEFLPGDEVLSAA
jgi:hypothetical protein